MTLGPYNLSSFDFPREYEKSKFVTEVQNIFFQKLFKKKGFTLAEVH